MSARNMSSLGFTLQTLPTARTYNTGAAAAFIRLVTRGRALTRPIKSRGFALPGRVCLSQEEAAKRPNEFAAVPLCGGA